MHNKFKIGDIIELNGAISLVIHTEKTSHGIEIYTILLEGNRSPYAPRDYSRSFLLPWSIAIMDKSQKL